MTTLTCPKCGSDMRSYERNRVLVDQCTGCGGLFLDRGELEKLVTAEQAWHAPPMSAPPAAPVPTPQDRRYDASSGQDRRYEDGRPDDRRHDRGDDRYGYQQPYRKKKSSFLAELFDD